MMSFKSICFLIASCSLRQTYAASGCTSPTQLLCTATTSPPTLDGTLSDWSNVKGITTPLVAPMTQTTYNTGDAQIMCQYDSTNIYLAFEIPGAYSFDATTDEKCPAVAVMMKIGTKATFYNMGGCPDFIADTGNDCTTIPTDKCVDYLVDIGAHWQVKSTKENTLYSIGSNGSGTETAPADEIAVSPFCRVEDAESGSGDGADEWSGAWSHTTSQAVSRAADTNSTSSNSSSSSSNSASSNTGSYIFELSRSLTTKSPSTDRQLTAGDSVDFGIAFWDPMETGDGWSDSGHYVSGCGSSFFSLVLQSSSSTLESPSSPVSSSGSSPSGSAPVHAPVAKPTTTSSASRLWMGTLQAVVVGGIFYFV